MSETPRDTGQTWRDWLSSTVIFRTFQVAVQPGKILLALAGLLLSCLLGVGMDAIWSAAGAEVYSGEINQYVTRPNFSAWKAQRRRTDTEVLAGLLVAHRVASDEDDAGRMLETDRAGTLDQLRDRLESEYAPRMDLEARRRAEAERIEALPKDEQESAREALVNLPGQVAQSRAEYRTLLAELANLGSRPIFSEWFSHELHFARAALSGLLRLNWAGRPSGDAGSAHPLNPFSPSSFLGAVGCMAGACVWMIREHPLYAVIFGILNLVVWSFFGAAVCRMAALQATQDQKISIGQAVRFARNKCRDFFMAPIIPFLFILVVGLALFLGGMFTAIPIVGEIVGTLMFPAALLGGFVITLVVVGFVGGLGMMWPTLGVEGSDSFDAISRSFSYVYNRPWRTIVLVLAMLIYGSLCYLFVRFFVWLMLVCTHVSVSLGTGLWADRPEAGAGMDKFSVMWEPPTYGDLRPQFEMVNLAGAEPFGAVVMWVCVSLVVLTMRAFVVSFLLSGFTWVYLLLRREVDATDLEDVYLEEEEPGAEAGAGAAEPAEPGVSEGKSLPVVEAPEAPPPEGPQDDSGGEGGS